ncbi:hypothetical protein Hanom_Chr10g00946211 [Helianthus anomalus]
MHVGWVPAHWAVSARAYHLLVWSLKSKCQFHLYYNRMLTKTAIFIRKVSLLIFHRVGKQTGFTCARANVGESLSVGVISRVMVTRAQAWCEIWDHTSSSPPLSSPVLLPHASCK